MRYDNFASKNPHRLGHIGHFTIDLDYFEEYLNRTGKPVSIRGPTSRELLSARACKDYIKLLKKEGKVAIAIACPSPRADGTCPTHPIPEEKIVNVLFRNGGENRA